MKYWFSRCRKVIYSKTTEPEESPWALHKAISLSQSSTNFPRVLYTNLENIYDTITFRLCWKQQQIFSRENYLRHYRPIHEASLFLVHKYKWSSNYVSKWNDFTNNYDINWSSTMSCGRLMISTYSSLTDISESDLRGCVTCARSGTRRGVCSSRKHFKSIWENWVRPRPIMTGH